MALPVNPVAAAERNRTTARRDMVHRRPVMIWDLLVCHASRRRRVMESEDLAVEAEK
jgi:hypothetical protein